MEGTRIGPYRVLGDLGSGGMGTVYLAETTRDAVGLDEGTRVALKVIHAHLLETEGFFKRFLREAEIGQRVEQANVVRCFDCDALMVEGHQQHFLVMEYVEGQTLRSLLDELGTVPEELCRHIGREIARGLTAIHEAGVIHRDLKPENVLITPDHVVKVMDLGVARLADEAVRLSQTGAFLGSLEYAAPEQFQRACGEPDGRTDLHALGLLLYELATGQHPYRDEDAAKVLRNILDVTPRKAGELNPQLSPFIEEAVHILLAKDRESRFGTAAELAAVLDEGETSAWWEARAKELRVATKRPLRRIRIPRETALYGRDDDLAMLRAAYDEAAGGDGRVLLIEGEAGIGKTRLVDEFVGRLRQDGEDLNFLFGSYPPGGAATTAGALSTAYREHFGSAGLEDTLREYLEPTPVLIPAFAALLRGETPPTGAAPLTKDSLQTVFVHATRGLAAERTTIILIDDLHFAPEDGRALFASLALAVPGHRVLLLGTMRPGVPEAWTTGVTRLEHADQIHLHRLGPKDLFRLLKDSFRSDRLAQELGMKISEKSDGNPFFALEIIRGLKEGQFVSQKPDGTWVTTKVIRDIQVPSSVLDLVQARIGDLSDDERNLLEAASCDGFEFEPSVVGAALGMARIPTLQLLGRVEKRHRLVRSAGRKMAFDHHQVREALYDGLIPELREEYHTAIADALEQRDGTKEGERRDIDGAVALRILEHHLAGTEPHRAVRYWPSAFAHLARGHLHGRVFEAGNRLLGVEGLLEGRERVALLGSLTKSHIVLGRPDEQRAALQEAGEVLSAMDSPEQDASLENRWGQFHTVCGDYGKALACYDRARERAEALGMDDLVAGVTVNSGNVCVNLGKPEEARVRLRKGLELARRCGNRLFEANALGGLANLLVTEGANAEARALLDEYHALGKELDEPGIDMHTANAMASLERRLGNLEEARSWWDRGLATARRIGNRREEANQLGNLAILSADAGRDDEARELWERCLAISTEIGDLTGTVTWQVNLAGLDLRAGRPGEAERRARDVVASSKASGFKAGHAYGMLLLGQACREMERLEDAREHIKTAHRLASDMGFQEVLVHVPSELALIAHGQGLYAESLAHAIEGIEAASTQQFRLDLANLRHGFALVLGRLGRFEDAREQVESAQKLRRAQEFEEADAWALMALGKLAWLEGDVAGAVRRYDEAVVAWSEFGRLEKHGDALLWLGMVREEAGDGSGARDCTERLLPLVDAAVKPSVAFVLHALRAVLGQEDAREATALLETVPDRLVFPHRLKGHWLLWRATGDRAYLDAARRDLDHLVRHAPESDRQTMLRRVVPYQRVVGEGMGSVDFLTP